MQPGHSLGSTALGAFEFYNTMQLEKVWGFAVGNQLDRERVMMTNVTQSLELCLKAMITHAHHLETGSFEFPSGHRISSLHEALPAQLRDELPDESRVFADSYAEYRSRIESEVRALHDQLHESLGDARAMRDERDRWASIAAAFNDSDYTAFINSNDPGMDLNKRRDSWLSDALNDVGDARGFGDTLLYYRYAPARDIDELPTDPSIRPCFSDASSTSICSRCQRIRTDPSRRICSD